MINNSMALSLLYAFCRGQYTKKASIENTGPLKILYNLIKKRNKDNGNTKAPALK